MSYVQASEVISTKGGIESMEISLVVRNVQGTINITDVMVQSGDTPYVWQGHPSEHKWSEDN